MDDNNNPKQRPDPKQNPFNQNGDLDPKSTLGEYDEYGNRVTRNNTNDHAQEISSIQTQTDTNINNPQIPQKPSQDPHEESRIDEIHSLFKTTPDPTPPTPPPAQLTPVADDFTIPAEPPAPIVAPPVPVVESQAPVVEPVEKAPPLPKVADAQDKADNPLVEMISSEKATEQSPDQKPTDKLAGKDRNIINKMKLTKPIVAAVIIIVTAGILLISGFMIQSGTFPLAKAPQQITTPESLAAKIASIVDLPIGEEPSQVVNVDNIKDLPESNPFSKVAQIGDLIIVYEKNKIAVLFRPRSGKVVSMGKLGNPTKDVAGSTAEDLTPTPPPGQSPSGAEPTPPSDSAEESESVSPTTSPEAQTPTATPSENH